tara:strand:- start:227 stop:658 length:432 start_codon:yes stop_codon:yes gene_type:complete
MIYSNDFIKFELIENNSIILITVLKDIPTREEYNNFIIQLDNLYNAYSNNNNNFSLLCDVRELGIVPLSYINEIKNFFVNKKEQTEHILNSTSIISTSMTVRSLFNGFLTIYTTIKPVKFVSTIDEALEFIKSIKSGERTLLN